jgi:hypothetical protein
VLPDQQNGFGTLSFAFLGIQNGAPDGLALVDDSGTVIEFLGYEGTFTAIDGPAAGLTPTDIGVAETTATPVGQSLQRIGSGTGDAFTWAAPQANTAGAVNTGQTFTASTVSAVPPVGVLAARIANIYPNPFNPLTTISFELGEGGRVRVEIFSVRGELVRTLVDEGRLAGEHFVTWNGRSDQGLGVPSGTYFCRVSNGRSVDTRPLLLLK